MTRHFGIRELASRTAVSAHTLRYYERAGIMLPVPRDDGGRRLYGETHVKWVEFLRRLRAAGMPISLVRQYAEWTVGDADPDGTRRRLLLLDHRAEVVARLEDLRVHLDTVDRKLADGCLPGDPGGS